MVNPPMGGLTPPDMKIDWIGPFASSISKPWTYMLVARSRASSVSAISSTPFYLDIKKIFLA